MGMQIKCIKCPRLQISPPLLSLFPTLLVDKIKKTNHVFFGSNSLCKNINSKEVVIMGLKYDPLVGRSKLKKRGSFKVISSSSCGNVGAPLWDTWSLDKNSPSPSFSDILWPSLGAFVAMAMMGKIDEKLARRGVSMTIAPFGAVCAILFITPKSAAARKYNMLMAQIGCSTIGVLAFSMFGPGWLARSVALAASIAFMIFTKSTHPPAASLPLLFIDGAKLHGLNFWYALFPGAAGCILISVIQVIVSYLQENFKF